MADGQIRPLRIRFQDEEFQQQRLEILEVMGKDEVIYPGAEAQIFLCRGTMDDRVWLVELKYSIRSHSWSMQRRFY
jgi:hypothetical protein